MFIREHEVAGGFCLHCGAREDAIINAIQGDTVLSCLKREGPQGEPKLRTMACEDVDAISERMTELAMEREAVLAAGETANEVAGWTLWVPEDDGTYGPPEYMRRWIMPEPDDDEANFYLRW